MRSVGLWPRGAAGAPGTQHVILLNKSLQLLPYTEYHKLRLTKVNDGLLYDL